MTEGLVNYGGRSSVRIASSSILAAAIGSAVLAGAVLAQVPVPVSPGAAENVAVTEARCPTFSWGGVAGAPGYELAVFRLSTGAADEPILVSRVRLPADSRAWTPSVGQCLVRGARYAWSVAAAARQEGAGRELEWAPAFLFEVESVEGGASVARADGSPGPAAVDPTPAGAGEELSASTGEPPPGSRAARAPSARDPRLVQALGSETALPGPLVASSGVPSRAASAASVPSLGAASLAVSNQIHLGAQSSLFKDDDVFLWDDLDGNTALGRRALASVSGDATRNTAFGRGALEYTSGGAYPFEGSYNTAVGDGALRYNTLGNSNTATGFLALAVNTVGFHNTATGSFALSANSTGARNTATGHYALRANSTGSYNTANGWESLRFNTSGFLNTASGAAALHSNTTGQWNTATGVNALFANTSGNRNTASGAFALSFNTTACCNTAIGTSALQYNTTGALNTASGDFSLRHNTTGHRNTANGEGALLHNTTGSDNAALGVAALYHNVSGSRNTASGAYALVSTTAGDRNTAVGTRSLQALTSGQRNIALGDGAGINLATGSDNVFIAHPGGSNESNVIRIGTQGPQVATFLAGVHGAPVAGDVLPVLVDVGGKLGTLASARALKTDIGDLGAFADRLLELRPVSFRFKAHVLSNPDAPLEFGLIAEEVAEVFPELVVYDEGGKPMTVKYHLLSSLLLGELQRMHERLEALESRSQDETGRRRALRRPESGR